MNTIRITTLTLLIPFGWSMSEAAGAYPEPLERIEMAAEFSPVLSCFVARVGHPIPKAPTSGSTNRPETTESHVVPSRLARSPEDRGHQIDTCRLNLDPDEID